MSKPLKIIVDGESEGAVKAFDKVGDSSRRLVKDVDDNTSSHARLGEKIGGNESKLMGTADLLDGLGGAFGLPTEGATKLIRGLGDMSGGFEVVSGMLPSLTGMFPKLGKAMTFISAHPLMIGLLAGGAIIGGLIMLEKKFGIVSDAVRGLGGAFGAIWGMAKGGMNATLNGIETFLNAIGSGINNTIGRLPGVPNFPRVNLPKLDVGGTVLQTGVAVVHRGEVVAPATGGGAGGTTVVVYVSGSITSDRNLVDAIHDGLLKKQSRSSLGFRAA